MVGAGPRREGGGIVAHLALFVVVCVVSGLLLAGLALPVVGGLGLVARSGASTFEPSALDTPALPQSSRLLDANGRVMATFFDEDRIDVPLSRVAPIMHEAIVAIEDARFYTHGGLDLRGTLRAAMANRKSGETQGGSSLTQQYVKNVLLQSAVARGDDAGVRSAVVADGVEGYTRKLRELQYAVALEDKLTKPQILERYLNIAYFGENAYGVEAAARRYFSKTAAKLTLPEAALLAGIVRSPSAYNPLQTAKSKKKAAEIAARVKGRRDVVIARMAELNYITEAQARAAKATKVTTKPSKRRSGCANATVGGYFCDFVEQTILNDARYGATTKARRDLLMRGGITIRSTFDPDMQRAADRALARFFRPTDAPIGAIAIVEPGTGKVKALAVNRPYGVDKKKRQNSINLAAHQPLAESSGAQPGSTFKPFVAAAALEQGYGFRYSIFAPRELVRQLRMSTCDGSVTEEPNIGRKNEYTPNNESASEHGVYDMRRAMWDSVNTYFLQLSEKTGLCRPSEIVNAMGVRVAGDGKVIPQDVGYTLGQKDTSPLHMARAYATFAARGVACDDIAIEVVNLRNGRPLEVARPSCRRVMEPEIADAVNYLLEGVVRNGTGRPADINRPQAGKTGTSEGFSAWFIGYTPNLATAVGVWDPRGRAGGVCGKTGANCDLRNVSIGGRTFARLQGRQLPAPLWAATMKAATAKLPKLDFVPPEGRFFDGTKGSGTRRSQCDELEGDERRECEEAARRRGGDDEGERERNRGTRERRLPPRPPIVVPQLPCRGKKCQVPPPPPPPGAATPGLAPATAGAQRSVAGTGRRSRP